MVASYHPRRFRFVANVVVAIVPTLCLLLMAEVVVRLTGAANSCPDVMNPEIWSCDPILGYTNRHDIVVYGKPLNKAGFRTHEFVPKAPGAFRILALGDSCTFGYVALDEGWVVEEPYPQVLERLAADRLEPGKVEVLNAGVAGYNSFNGLMLLRLWLRSLAPDLVTVRFGWNDHFVWSGADVGTTFHEPSNPISLEAEDFLLRTALYPFARRLGMELRFRLNGTPKPGVGRVPKRWVPTIPLPDYQHNLRRTVEVARSHGARVWLLTAPDALLGEDALRRYEELPPEATARRAVTLNALPSFRQLMEVHASYVAATREVGNETGVPIVDMAAIYRQHAEERLFSVSDVVHPTQIGHEFEAEVLLERLVADGLIQLRTAQQATSSSTASR